MLNQFYSRYCNKISGPFHLNIKKLISNNSAYSSEESYETYQKNFKQNSVNFFLELINTHHNLACKSETGRFPLAISTILLSLKYWLHTEYMMKRYLILIIVLTVLEYVQICKIL